MYTKVLLSSFSFASIITIIIRRFAMLSFRLSIAIHGDKHSIKKHKTFQILSRYSMAWTCKNITRKNGSFSQYRYFLHNKLLLPTTNPCRSTNVDGHSERLFETMLGQEKILTFISYIEKREKSITLSQK